MQGLGWISPSLTHAFYSVLGFSKSLLTLMPSFSRSLLTLMVIPGDACRTQMVATPLGWIGGEKDGWVDR